MCVHGHINRRLWAEKVALYVILIATYGLTPITLPIDMYEIELGLLSQKKDLPKQSLAGLNEESTILINKHVLDVSLYVYT